MRFNPLQIDTDGAASGISDQGDVAAHHIAFAQAGKRDARSIPHLEFDIAAANDLAILDGDEMQDRRPSGSAVVSSSKCSDGSVSSRNGSF